MLMLNFGSEELKKEFRLKRIYQLIKKVDYFVVSIFVVLAIILIVAKIIMINNLNEINKTASIVTENGQNYSTEIQTIRNDLRSIKQIQESFLVWTKLISTIAGIRPSGINFSYLKSDSQTNKIILRGVSGSRESLLLLKKNIESNDMFKNVKLPIKNILNKTNDSFEIEADIDTKKIKL